MPQGQKTRRGPGFSVGDCAGLLAGSRVFGGFLGVELGLEIGILDGDFDASHQLLNLFGEGAHQELVLDLRSHLLESRRCRLTLFVKPDDVPAELGLDGLRNGAFFERKGSLLEIATPPPAR